MLLRSRKSRRTTTESDDARLDAIVNEKQTAADAPDDAARNQLYAALSQGIDELSETLRTTLVLVCIDGRSHEEASAMLGAPEGIAHDLGRGKRWNQVPGAAARRTRRKNREKHKPFSTR